VRGILHSFYVATCFNRTFLLDWSKPSSLQDIFEPAYVPWNRTELSKPTAFIPAINKRTTNQGIYDFLKQHENVTGIEIWSNAEWTEKELLRQCFPQLEQEGGGGAKTSHRLFYNGFYTLLRFKDVVEKRRREILRSANVSEESRTYVGIHLRTGSFDSYKETNRHSPTNGTYYKFLDRAHKLEESLVNTSCETHQAYLASDHTDSKRSMQALDGPDSSIRVATDLHVAHIDRRNEDARGQLDVWAELLVLIRAVCLVKSRSGFSDLADVLSPQYPRCKLDARLENQPVRVPDECSRY